ncbi:MAG: GNAT family protein [Caulobacteraceae bacterium]|nr:GNAT family protein [Caulobacteraceae bacterium]
MSLDQAFEVLDDDAACNLRTARFSLEPLAPEDLDALLVHFGDPRVTEFLDIQPLVDRSGARDVLDWAEALRGSGLGLRWGIRDEARRFVGTCGFHMMTFERGRRAEIGYDLEPGFWGRGVMAEVLPAALTFGYDVLGLHRIEAMVTPGNARSCAVLERHGFRREGVLRDYAFWRERFWDQILYARLAGDPVG